MNTYSSYDNIKLQWSLYSVSAALFSALIAVLIFKLFKYLSYRVSGKHDDFLIDLMFALASLNVGVYSYRFYAPYLLDFFGIEKILKFNVGIAPYLVISLIFAIVWLIINVKIQLHNDLDNE